VFGNCGRAFIGEGLVPCPFFEGEYSFRLDIIKDIPRGKPAITLRPRICERRKRCLETGFALGGGVPGSLLVTGTPGEVKEYCRTLLRDVAGDDGFILDATTTLDDARPDNVKALFDSVTE
jgi:hypothetical protein